MIKKAKFLTPFIIFVLTFIFSGYSFAQEDEPPDAACIGAAVGQYASEVLDLVGSDQCFGDVCFLSPAFNTTHPSLEILTGAMAANVDFSRFYAIAGNAYNLNGSTPISAWVERLRQATGSPPRIVLTEVGWFYSRDEPGTAPPPDRPGEVAWLKSELNGQSGDVIGMMLFNVFGTGNNDQFGYHIISDPEINDICNNGPCGRIGANSAAYYTTSGMYSSAASHGMGWTIEIANNDTNRSFPSIMPGIQAAHAMGAVPVLRIGVGENSGGFDNPSDLAQFIRDIDALVSQQVMVIIGPNEPISECWASPQCGCDLVGAGLDVPITFYGQVTTQLPTSNGSGNIISQQAVRGATIGLYEGTPRTDVGNEYGILHKFDDVATDGNGMYEITGVRRASGSHDNAIWMFVWCGETLVDTWKLDLSVERRQKDLNEPCIYSDYPEPPRPPDSVRLNALGDKLVCSTGNEYDVKASPPRSMAPGFYQNINILQLDIDDTFVGAPVFPLDANGYPAAIPPSRTYVTDAEFLARADFSRNASATGLGAALLGTNGFGPIDPLLEGEEPVDKLPFCEDVKYANSTIANPGDPVGRNTHQMYSIAATLSAPGMWERFYRSTDLQREICLDPNGDPVRLCEIEPPNDFSIASRTPTCGEYAYDSNYFPYIWVMCDPESGSRTEAWYQPILDTYDPVDLLEGTREDPYVRQIPFTPDRQYATQERTYNPGGSPEYSKICAALLSDASEARNFGEENPFGAVLADPYQPFGCDTSESEDGQFCTSNTDLGSNRSNIITIGKGDHQMRPYELCTCNSNDVGCEYPFNELTGSVSELTHPWQSGYRYLTADGIGRLDGIGGFLFRLLFGWTIDITRMERTPEGVYKDLIPTDLIAQVDGVTQQDWDPVTQKFLVDPPICVPLEWQSSGNNCFDPANNPDDYDCRANCTAELPPDPNCDPTLEPDGICPPQYDSCGDIVSGCGSDIMCGYNTTPPPECSALVGVSCNYEIQNAYGAYGTGSYFGDGRCIGDLRTTYAGVWESFEDSRFDRSSALGLLQATTHLADPFLSYSTSGLATVNDEPLIYEETGGRETQAANATGPGAAPLYNGTIMSYLKDPTYSNAPAPDFVGQLPDATPGGPGGTGIGNGRCQPAPDGSPCSVDNLLSFFSTEENATIASIICNRESGGSPTALNDSCTYWNDGDDNDNDGAIDEDDEGGTYDYSVGLFQINLIDDREGLGLPSAGGYGRCAGVGVTGAWAQALERNPDRCEVRGPLDQCVAAFMDPAVSINWAATRAGCGDGNCDWSPWSAAAYCDIV